MLPPKDLFQQLFNAAVEAAHPMHAIRQVLPERPKGRLIVIGAGKSTGEMAKAFEAAWEGLIEGAIVVPHGHEVECDQIEVLHSRHPVPDQAGLLATKRLFDLARSAGEDDLVVALISGGGSSLLPAPPDGMTLDDEIAVNKALLESGAPITAMNRVRKFLSTVKGGQLALAAFPAKVLTLIVSDVPGDDPAMVASGPTVPDRSTRVDALEVVSNYRIPLPSSAAARLNSPDADLPDLSDPRYARNQVKIIASASRSLEAVVEKARALGVEAHILSEAIEGEAKEVAKMHAAIAREVQRFNRPFKKPVLLISGGETTVTIAKSAGKGGRNSEFLLSFANEIDGAEGIHSFAADTDGIDGSEKNAGAFADGGTTQRMRKAGIDPRKLLADHDAYTGFEAIGDLFSPGPTGTNVNDLRLILIS
jgi:glycerate 2-kinase